MLFPRTPSPNEPGTLALSANMLGNYYPLIPLPSRTQTRRVLWYGNYDLLNQDDMSAFSLTQTNPPEGAVIDISYPPQSLNTHGVVAFSRTANVLAQHALWEPRARELYASLYPHSVFLMFHTTHWTATPAPRVRLR